MAVGEAVVGVGAGSVALGVGCTGAGSTALGVGCTGGCALAGTQLTLITNSRLARQKAAPRWLSLGLLLCILVFINSLLRYMVSFRPPNWFV